MSREQLLQRRQHDHGISVRVGGDFEQRIEWAQLPDGRLGARKYKSVRRRTNVIVLRGQAT